MKHFFKTIFPIRINLISSLIAFTIFCLYYIALLFRHTNSDISSHVNIAYAFAVKNDRLIPNFFYYVLVATLSGFSKNIYIYFTVAIILLAASLAAKLVITKIYIEKYALPQERKKYTSLLLAIALLFVFALPGLNLIKLNQFYLGQITPNVWHNSTVIFLMPFAIILFFQSYELLVLPIGQLANKKLIGITILVILNAIIKPSLLFTLLPTLFVFFCYYKFFKKSKIYFKQMWPYFAGIIVILGQYFLIYRLNYVSSLVRVSESAGGVGIAPFEIWRYYSSNILVSAITSLFFPIVYIILSKGSLFKSKLVQFAMVNFVFGLAIWILVVETGYRRLDGNFGWQLIISDYLLFFCLIMQFIKDCNAGDISKTKQYIIGGSFLLHLIWGIIYWLKIIIFRQFY